MRSKCTVKGNEMYPSNCNGWSIERGGYKCLTCPYYKEVSIDLTPKYERPVEHVPTPLYGTWSRQFVKVSIDECE